MKKFNWKSTFSITILFIGITAFIKPPSDESKTWEASEKAKVFVKNNIVIDFFLRQIGLMKSRFHHFKHQNLDFP